MRLAVVVCGLGACGRIDFAEAPRDTGTLDGCTDDPTLVAYWPLDEGSGTIAYDHSGNRQDGTLTNDAAWTAGHIGGAIDTRTNGAVVLANTLALSFGGGTGSFTLSYWLEPIVLTPGADMRAFEVALCTGPGYIVGVVYDDAMNGPAAGMQAYDSGNNNVSNNSTFGAPTTGSWTHVVHVMNRAANVGQTYINGVASGTPVDLSGLVGGIDCADAVLITNLGGVDTFHYTGLIDDVRVYSRALDQTDITSLFEQTTGGC
jgi:hypothetical protein